MFKYPPSWLGIAVIALLLLQSPRVIAEPDEKSTTPVAKMLAQLERQRTQLLHIRRPDHHSVRRLDLMIEQIEMGMLKSDKERVNLRTIATETLTDDELRGVVGTLINRIILLEAEVAMLKNPAPELHLLK